MTVILFTSLNCEYCKEIIDLIDSMDELKVKISIIDVKKLKSLPNFLDRVPMLLFEEESKILHDESLFEWITNNEKTIEPFMINEMHGLSDKYSFMDDKNLEHKYAFVADGPPVITENISEKESKRIINYDEFVEDRDKDMSGIFKQQFLPTETEV